MKTAYYIVQVTARLFAARDVSGVCLAMGMENAARLTLPEARRVLRDVRQDYGDNGPRRFPRIVKVTIETTTITEG